MKAVIVCSGRNPALLGLDEHQPGALMPLGDRPFLQHVVEYLALAGSREFEFILTHLPEKVESHFGDGSRWGCKFTYHLAAGAEQSWRVLRNICAGYEGTVLLAQSDALPVMQDVNQAIALGSSILCGASDGQPSWSGWACFPAKSAPILFPTTLHGNVSDHLAACAARGEVALVPVELWINCQTPEGILQSQHLLLRGEVPGLMINGNKAEKGICIGHGASIHPTARLLAPLFIGPNCRIGAGVVAGPGAVVGENCIVDDDTSIVNSMTTPGTYIGQGLELDGVVVDRNRLVNTRLGTACLISESFLVGSLSGTRTVPLLRGLADRVTALLLYFVTLPVLVAMFLRSRLGSGIAMNQSEFVRLPASEDPRTFVTCARSTFNGPATPCTRWQHFTREFVPGLLSVVRGRLNLVGVPPRSARTIQHMPADWRGVYLSCKAGLITESLVVYGGNPSLEEAYSADAFYRAMDSTTYDCRLMLRYLVQVIFEPYKHVESEIITDCEAK
jgi:NDP-sugar pyrophosphorylase family protein